MSLWELKLIHVSKMSEWHSKLIFWRLRFQPQLIIAFIEIGIASISVLFVSASISEIIWW